MRTAKKTTPLTVKQFEAEVRRMDHHIDGSQLKAAVILLAAIQEGPDRKRLIEFTGYSATIVGRIVQRLRKNGVFVGEQVAGADWFDKDMGGTAFWCDVCVALGFLRRA